MSEKRPDSAKPEESQTTRTGTAPSASASADPAADRARWGDVPVARDTAEIGRDVVRFVVGGAMLAALVVLPRVEFGEPVTDGALEVAIRTTAGIVEHCRDRTEEELVRLAVHMRRPTVCTLEVVPYVLDVDIDGERRVSEEHRSSGIHGDRPITVSRRLTLEPGEHRVRVRFYPRDTAEVAGELADERALPEYELETDVLFEAGRVRLAVLTQATQNFELR